MIKQTQNSARLSIELLTLGVIAAMALFFSSCKKKKESPPLATKTFYTIAFNSKGYTAIRAVEVKQGHTLTLPNSSIKTDFVFGGWHIGKKASASLFSATTPINADITLYAKWNAVTSAA